LNTRDADVRLRGLDQEEQQESGRGEHVEDVENVTEVRDETIGSEYAWDMRG
jgi:hypothetical protein